MLFLVCLTSFTNRAAPGAASGAPQGTGSAQLRWPLGTGTSPALGSKPEQPRPCCRTPRAGAEERRAWLRPRESSGESPAQPSLGGLRPPVLPVLSVSPDPMLGQEQRPLCLWLRHSICCPLGTWQSKGGGQVAQHEVQDNPCSSLLTHPADKCRGALQSSPSLPRILGTCWSLPLPPALPPHLWAGRSPAARGQLGALGTAVATELPPAAAGTRKMHLS